MKKAYITPEAFRLTLNGGHVLLDTSGAVDINKDPDHIITGGNGDGAWTQGQSPIWDTWK